ncbi:MAG TPA: ThuA domain-containing protein [Verrucomicrobiae bacterium]|nr:ThuA domain-containing protein [Verrucomicrobiae bacterium]
MKIPITALILLLPWAGFAAPLHVLMLSGANNHDWRATTPVLKKILEADGRFLVDVETNVPGMRPDAFANYDVVLSNFNTFGQTNFDTVWHAPMRAAFVDFIHHGHGLVIVHAGSSAFYNCPEFQQLAGAVWGPGTEHGRIHMDQIHIVSPEHPVTAGVEDFPTIDEFWQDTHIKPTAKPLATVTPLKEFGGSGKPEPIAFATELYGGRGFTLLLGHDTRAMKSEGFQNLLRRGTEWAATGKVSSAPAGPTKAK